MAMPRTPDDAHAYAMRVVEDLRTAGIDVSVEMWTVHEETRAKYAGQPGRASTDRWCHVCLKPATKEQRALVLEKAIALRTMGMSFDTGGCRGQRDWELDWSFHFEPREDQNTVEHEVVEDMIEDLCDDPDM